MKKEYLKLPINSIVANDLNPRIHNKSNVAMIKRSMKKVGVIDNIIIDENNVILAGHGRFLALKELGKKEVDVTKISGLTDAQKKQYIVYSNRTTEKSEWNGELLVNLTDEILKTDFDFNVGDFEIEELTDCYKMEEIDDNDNPAKQTEEKKELHIFGICYYEETKEINDFYNSLKSLTENKDVEIFKGKKRIIEDC